MDPNEDTAGVIAFPPAIYGVALAAGLLADRFVPLPSLPKSAARICGVGCLVLAAALGPPAFARMRSAGTNVDPYEPTLAIVDDGPFAYSRNPLYVALALAYSGIALCARASLPLALLPAVLAVVQRGVIEREERYLERKFGTRYLDYKHRVRRWL